MAKGQRERETSRERADRDRQRHWRHVFAKQAASGLSHSKSCRQNSISLNTYFWWKRELPRKLARVSVEDAPRLVAVSVREVEGPRAGESWPSFEVVLHGGRVLRVASGFDADELRRLVSLLEESRC